MENLVELNEKELKDVEGGKNLFEAAAWLLGALFAGPYRMAKEQGNLASKAYGRE